MKNYRIVLAGSVVCMILPVAGCSPVAKDEGAGSSAMATAQTSGDTTSSSSSSSTSSSTTTADGVTNTRSDSTGDGASSSTVSDSRSNGARKVSIETDLIMFEYTYPAKAGNIAKLDALLGWKLQRAKRELESQARESKADAIAGGFPYRKNSYEQIWQVVADLPRFLSLNADIATYSGGAHGNAFHDALIWDRRGGVARDPMDLFTSPDAFWNAASKRYCAALDRERRKKGAPTDRKGLFGECPKLKELTVLIGSASRAKFDRVELLAAPYVAGSYAEGTYAVTLPVDGAMLAAVKPEYRSYFDAS